jgi:glycosidase
MLQWFDGSWRSMTRRAPDIFMAGYGSLWIPPASRADSGNQSVGYDVYDRFDLGNADNPTLYGTEKGIRNMIAEMRKIRVSTYADQVLNHNGFSDQSNIGFVNSGGYPGFVMSRPGAPWGDFHPAGATGDLEGRLAGLIDINQATNFRFVRSPVPNPVGPNGETLTNIPAGTTEYFGKLANIPTEANRRFYQNRTTPSRLVFNPTTGQGNIPIYDFVPGANPANATIVEENALGYLMRHTQWMLQDVGVDGFRLDATKHIPTWVLNDFFDMNVYRGNPRLNLDGSVKHVFSFGENFDGSRSYLQTYIRKDINPNDPGRVGGNRDTKDFPLFFAMSNNLTSNGVVNDWRNVVNASQDVQDDGFANNGSQGVAFVQSHDSFGPHLSNVAHAYMLMRPGEAIVYFNGKEFGNNRDFPKDGRGDALGGQYGNAITTLTNIRNTHGRGNYLERFLTKETLVYERDKSAVVALSNRLDAGFDTVTVQTAFNANTRLVEMTGNATDSVVDPSNNISDWVIVDSLGRITINVPRNRTGTNSHGKGYVIYGLPTPRGTLTLDGAASTIPGQTPTPGTNGTARITPIDVVTGNSFTINLQTIPVVIGGFTDTFAGGDNAVFSINGGLNPDNTGNDLNGNGQVDFRTPGTVVYGFEQFVTKRSPLVGGGDGQYLQTIDTTKLVEGFNYLEVRAFRNRPANEPAVYSSFRKVIYIDRLPAVLGVESIRNLGGNNRQVRVSNPDKTADSVHVMLNLGAAVDALSLVSGSNSAGQIDTDLWAYGFNNMPSGNHVFTVVGYEPSGRSVVQRVVGQFIQTGRGLGLGDINFDNVYSNSDVTSFETVLYSRNQQFNPGGDLNADGFVDNRDLWQLQSRYVSVGAGVAANAARQAVIRRGNFNADGLTNATDIDLLLANRGAPSDLWLYDLNVDGSVTQADVDVMLSTILLTTYGDINLDRRVDFTDLVELARNYNQTGGWAKGNFDGDGTIGFADLVELARNYGFGVAGGESFDFALAQLNSMGYYVPEPAVMSVLTIAGLTTLRRARRGK